MSTFHDELYFDNGPPMLHPGTYTTWRLNFKLWLTNFDDAELMLNSINHGPYEMKFIADQGNPGIIRLQFEEELNVSERAQYAADSKVKIFIILALPNELYCKMDRHDSAYDLWMTFASMHREEELQLIRQDIQPEYGVYTDPMQAIVSTSSSTTQEMQTQELIMEILPTLLMVLFTLYQMNLSLFLTITQDQFMNLRNHFSKT